MGDNAEEIKIPSVGESVTEAEIGSWEKESGDAVEKGEILALIETDKASLEIPAARQGRLIIVKPAGETVEVGQVIGRIEALAAESGSSKQASPAAESPAGAPAKLPPQAPLALDEASAPLSQPAAPLPAAPAAAGGGEEPRKTPHLSPAVRRLVQEKGLNPSSILGTGKGGRLTKGDILKELEKGAAAGSDGRSDSAAIKLSGASGAAGHKTEIFLSESGELSERAAQDSSKQAAGRAKAGESAAKGQTGAPAAVDTATSLPASAAARLKGQTGAPAAVDTATSLSASAAERLKGQTGAPAAVDTVKTLSASAAERLAEPVDKPKPRLPEAQTTAKTTQRREKMSRLRRAIAHRLVQSQATTASLSTFNEADMSRILSIRKKYQELFIKKHGLKLGFMGFFTKAAAAALKAYPRLNGFIEGDEIVYNSSAHIGIAVSAPAGLVVPVLRAAEKLSLPQIEAQIRGFAAKAQERRLTPEDLAGGTFTISNGGVFGSLLSTPILNPPQSGVLGLHKIQERPVACEGRVEIRPMMYLTLSYDHRIVDGREAVGFLAKIKAIIEDPDSLLIDL